MQKIIRKAVTMLLAGSMFLSNVPMAFASDSGEVTKKDYYEAGLRATEKYTGVNLLELDMEMPAVLESANSIVLVENTLYDDFIVTVDWNRFTNEVVIKEEYLTPVADASIARLLSEDNSLTNTFTLDISADSNDEDGFVFLNTVDFNGMALNLEEAVEMGKSGNVPRVGLAGVIGGSLLDQLIGLGLTIEVGKMVYALAQEIASVLKKKSYKHYYAKLDTCPLTGQGRNLFIGDPFPDTTTAVSWFNFRNDVFSPRKDDARTVAYRAGGNKEPIWDPPHNIWDPSYYPHYHKAGDSSTSRAHSFHLTN